MLSRNELKALRKWYSNESEYELAKEYCEDVGDSPYNWGMCPVVYVGEKDLENALDDLIKGRCSIGFDDEDDEDDEAEFRSFAKKNAHIYENGIVFDLEN